ncbi:MAG: LTA synthase family protein [Bacteroidota bacterium]|nr:LTA synthase family protein [Bacteroidota bacterium]
MSEIATVFLYGLRFDISAIIYFNIILIFLHIVPTRLRDKRYYRVVTKITFIAFNGIALLLNIVDLEYFKFTKKRMTFDVFGMSSDWIKLLPDYFKDFWYLPLVLIGLLVIAIVLYRKTNRQPQTIKINYLIQGLGFIVMGGLFLVGARGGLQLKPIKIIDAVLYATPHTTPLVLNTPFTMIQTYGRKRLKELNYFSNEEANNLFPIYHHTKPKEPFRKQNVVIIIVESLSREFIGGKGVTPFLDSLCQHSIYFDNAFANGTRSMEAVPAILSSIPHLMEDSYIFSSYQGNKINSIASLLKEKGYHTSFSHGGTNGTMGFDSFVKMAGIDNYYGRTEYNNDKDYDGRWGIYDEEFLQFTAQKLNESPLPFFATIFTLSSHHPYSIPEKYATIFGGGRLEIHNVIRYVDYSLRMFFEKASKMGWYSNTLFVITGDHTPAESENSFYKNQVGMFAVPIVLFQPNSNLPGVRSVPAQHIDIMPTILDYLNYDGDFMAFGSSLFDTVQPRYVINYLNDSYRIFDKEYALSFDGEKTVNLFQYTTDGLLTVNKVSSQNGVTDRLEQNIKAVLQVYHHSLINNLMTIPR